MASCYDIEGQEIPCGQPGCIGSDCIGNQDFGGVTIPGTYEGGLTYNFHDMTEEEFQQWFLDQYDWGEEQVGYTSYAEENPHLVDPEQAMLLSGLFSGYRSFGEDYLIAQTNKHEQHQDMMFEEWESAADILLAEKSGRSQAIQLKQQDIIRKQGDVDRTLATIQEQNTLLDLQDEKMDILSNQARGGGRYAQDAMEEYQSEVMKIFSDFNVSRKSSKDAEDLSLNLASRKVLQASEDAAAKLDLEKLGKETTIQLSVDKMNRETNKKIWELRDAHEASVWDGITNLLQSGAFFDEVGDFAETPGQICIHVNETTGECDAWNLGLDDAGDGQGLCTITCCSSTGQTMQVACNEIAQGVYFGGDFCCPGNDPDAVPCCLVNEIGQCLGSSIPGCICPGSGDCV
tara:strand:- start:309 stop:1514 length:1206 start_codon:yes stop_codon:yes gene_type:complete